MIDKRVFSNASLLYLRMLVMTGITFVNTKFLLKYLGLEDFGIYSLVWGLVIIMGFVNNSITGAVQRFLNISIANNDTEKLISIYSVSLTIFIVIGTILASLLLLIKDILFTSFLEVPNNKIEAASYVYYFMTASFFFNFISLNYHSTLIASEKFSFYATVTIIESILKLTSTLLLVLVSNRLFYYGLFLCISSITILAILTIYCKSNIYFCQFRVISQWIHYKEILKFVSWNLLGSLGMVASTQGIPLVANIFYGVTINASLNISNQLSSLIRTVTSNFQSAFSPYLMKSYVNEVGLDLKIITLSKISVYFYCLVAMPIIFYTDYILNLWLGMTPKYVSGIVKISAYIALLEVLAGPLWMLIQAEGNIKFYQISVLCIMVLNIPLSYIVLSYGFSIYHVWYMLLISNIVLLVIRIFFISRILNKGFTITYIKRLLSKVILFLSISSFIAYYLSSREYNIAEFIILNVITSIISTFLAVLILTSNRDRLILKQSTVNLMSTIRNKF